MLKLLIPISCLLFLPLTSNKFFHQTWIFCFFISFRSLFIIPTNLSRVPLVRIFSLDTISSSLIILSIWITSLILLARYNIIKYKKSPKLFSVTVLILLITLILTFSANRIILFYILFEASLIPTLLLIILWGYQPERLNAGFYLILYTITASLPLLIGIILIYSQSHHLSILIFNIKFFISLRSPLSCIAWLIIVLAFLVKMPLYLVHLWLPKAHVEAPVAGSIVLAGILLKLGSYGLIRVALLFQIYITTIVSLISRTALFGAFITGFICIRQHHIKSLIAYSSVGHIGLLTAGLISCTAWGWYGSLILIVAHGLCSSCLFAISNIYYESSSTQRLFLTKGILSLFPASTFWFFMARAGNIAAPPSINLIGEILLLTRILSSSFYTWFLIGWARFLSAAYSLFLYTSTQHGPAPNFVNPTKLFIIRNYSVCFIHLAPLFLLSLKAELLRLWIWLYSWITTLNCKFNSVPCTKA